MSHFVITGGHHNSALVVAQELVRRGHIVDWLGHRYASGGDTHDSSEYIEVKATGIPFHHLVAGKISRIMTFDHFFKLPLGLFNATRELKSLRPDVVISFGGYLGATVSLSAWLLHIPVFIHEQTCVTGKATNFTSYFARRIYLTWASSLSSLPNLSPIRSRAKVVGLPLREIIIKTKKTKLFANGKPTLLIMGGKQGSHILNQKIFTHLPELLSRYNLIHQTGTSSVTKDFETALAQKDALSADLVASYFPYSYLSETDVARYLAGCDLYIGRSGAHTTYELGVLGKRAILIPYLLTHNLEQQKNARLLESQGLGIIIPESQLTFPRLVHEIDKALHLRNAKPLPLPLDASNLLIEDTLANLS